jgi:hypothetical protein
MYITRTVAAAVLAFSICGAYAATDRDIDKSAVVSSSIVTRLSTNKDTRNLHVQVDVYKDLAVLHGWTLTRAQRARVERVVREQPGILAVHNNIVTDDDDYSAIRNGYGISRNGRAHERQRHDVRTRRAWRGDL